MEFTGEHDLTTREETADLLSRALSQNDLVVVDISEAEFIDSTFINNLFIADGFARKQGKVFRLQVATAPIVRRALEITGVLDRIEHASNREDVLSETKR